MNLFFFGSRTLNKRGMGMLRMMKSEDILKTAFVIKWFVAAEHCSVLVSSVLLFFGGKASKLDALEFVGTAQYWLNGLHHTPK